MSLQISRQEREGVVILDLEGPLISGESEAELRETFRLLDKAGDDKIALNLEKVSNIDSAGMGALVFGLVKVRKAGGRLALFHLNSSHLNLLVLTRLVTVFEIYDDEQDAVNSCFPGRATRSYDILSFVQRQPTNAVISGPPDQAGPSA